ncbi:MAG: DUF4352 domain-containing protein, partial [Candidatus Micrarchaeota archaeon]
MPNPVSPSSSSPRPPAPTPEVKTVKVGNIGETLTDGKLKITLNSVQYLNQIPSDNQFLSATAKPGKIFAIVDVLIENIDQEPTSISSITQFKVKDTSQGYNYDVDFMGYIGLQQQVDGKLQPGDKIRGKLAFLVPAGASDLQLVFSFGFLDYAQAKFNIG